MYVLKLCYEICVNLTKLGLFPVLNLIITTVAKWWNLGSYFDLSRRMHSIFTSGCNFCISSTLRRHLLSAFQNVVELPLSVFEMLTAIDFRTTHVDAITCVTCLSGVSILHIF